MNIGTIPISICIPIYNGSRFLYDCFKSIQAQTFTNFEIIVVDDCSQDESYQIVKELTSKIKFLLSNTKFIHYYQEKVRTNLKPKLISWDKRIDNELLIIRNLIIT